MCWEITECADAHPAAPAEPVLAAVAAFVQEEGTWKGTAMELVEVLQHREPELKIWPNTRLQHMVKTGDFYPMDYRQILLEEREMIQLAQAAENRYVGVACGKLDQSCEVYSKKDHLLYLDTKDDSYELIPTNPKMKPYEIVIFFSGIERSLAGSKFNMRVDECKSAAYALMAFEGIEYGKFNEAFLRDVPEAVYHKHKGSFLMITH